MRSERDCSIQDEQHLQALHKIINRALHCLQKVEHHEVAIKSDTAFKDFGAQLAKICFPVNKNSHSPQNVSGRFSHAAQNFKAFQSRVVGIVMKNSQEIDNYLKREKDSQVYEFRRKRRYTHIDCWACTEEERNLAKLRHKDQVNVRKVTNISSCDEKTGRLLSAVHSCRNGEHLQDSVKSRASMGGL